MSKKDRKDLPVDIMKFLFEDADYSYDGMSFHDDSPTPYDMGSGNSGYSYGGVGKKDTFLGSTVLGMFLNPAVDIAKTALWGTKYLTTKVKFMAASLIGGAVAGLIPGTDYERGGKYRTGVGRVFGFLTKEEQDELNEIDKQYGDVLKRNMEAMKNGDALSVLFLLSPENFLAAALASEAPELSLEALDTVSGGLASNMLLAFRRRYYRHSPYRYAQFAEALGDTDEKDEVDGDSGEEKPMPSDEELLAKPPTKEEIEKITKSPQMKKALEKPGGLFHKLKNLGKKALFKRVSKGSNINTIEDLDKVTGKAYSKTFEDKMNQEKVPSTKKDLMKNEFLNQVKTDYTNEYMKLLNELESKIPSATGVVEQAKTLLPKPKTQQVPATPAPVTQK